MDFEIVDEETGKVIGHADCGCTSKDEVIAGLAEINAFCEMFIKEFNCGNAVFQNKKDAIMKQRTLEEEWEYYKELEEKGIDPFKSADTNKCQDCTNCLSVCPKKYGMDLTVNAM